MVITKRFIRNNNETIANFLERGFASLQYWTDNSGTITNNNYDLKVKYSEYQILFGTSARLSETDSMKAGLSLETSFRDGYYTDMSAVEMFISENEHMLTMSMFAPRLSPSTYTESNMVHAGFFISLVEDTTDVDSTTMLWWASRPIATSNFGILYDGTWYQNTLNSTASLDSRQGLLNDLTCHEMYNLNDTNTFEYKSRVSVHINTDDTDENKSLSLVGFIPNAYGLNSTSHFAPFDAFIDGSVCRVIKAYGAQDISHIIIK